MAKRKKPAARKRSVPKQKPAQTQRFAYSLPVCFTVQFGFSESKILNPDDDDPEISENAISELEAELTEYLGQNYAIAKVTVLDDALDSLRRLQSGKSVAAQFGDADGSIAERARLSLLAREGVEVDQQLVADQKRLVVERHGTGRVVAARRAMRDEVLAMVDPAPFAPVVSRGEHHREGSFRLVHAAWEAEVLIAIIERDHALDRRSLNVARCDLLGRFCGRPSLQVTTVAEGRIGPTARSRVGHPALVAMIGHHQQPITAGRRQRLQSFERLFPVQAVRAIGDLLAPRRGAAIDELLRAPE